MNKITIPHPGEHEHSDNLCTIPLLEAQGFQGSDASLEESLFCYDLIWRTIPVEGDEPERVMFVYRISGLQNWDKKFDRLTLDPRLDFRKEFNWMDEEDWASVAATNGCTTEEWFAQSFERKIGDLYNHYGYENVFGASHWSGFSIRDPDHFYGETGTLTLDLVPYDYEWEDDEFTFEDFTAFDLRVPERYQNTKGGEYNTLLTHYEVDGREVTCTAIMEMTEGDLSVSIRGTHRPIEHDLQLEALCNALGDHFDALKEIGWEAFSQEG